MIYVIAGVLVIAAALVWVVYPLPAENEEDKELGE